MSVVIRMMRGGAKKRPSYRMVAADSRRQRDGRFLEILGHYNPLAQPYELVVHKDKVEKWLSRGAQPSEQAASLLRSLGITMQRAVAARPEAVEVPAVKAQRKPAARGARRVPRKLSERKARRRVMRRQDKKKAAEA